MISCLKMKINKVDKGITEEIRSSPLPQILFVFYRSSLTNI